MSKYVINKLNLESRNKMKGIINNDVYFAWENQKLMDLLLGKLPEIRYTNYDSDISDELNVLHKIYDRYECQSTDRQAFHKDVEMQINKIKSIKPTWYGLDSIYVKEALRIHEFCLIVGEGGIGKSYYLYCLEKELTEKSIPHLCFYGKFEKSCQRIPIEEIIELCDREGFVFIFDAINEMFDQAQKDLLKIIQSFATHKKMRIILSYRLNSLESSIEKQFEDIAKYIYTFPGVSFESAMGELTKLAIPDIFRYEDILYSNNALLLNMLCSALSDDEIINGDKNSIASVTFILEYYVKKSLKRTFGKKLPGTVPLDMWRDMKRVASWMYKHERKGIEKASLLATVRNGPLFIEIMKQVRFIESYESDGNEIYYFAIDTLTDYLIARSLFEDISGKSFDDQVEIIKRKTGRLYNTDSAFLIALFDNLSPDYEYISKLIKASELNEYFGYDELLKINIRQENIVHFLQVFSPANPDELFTVFGGYSDKPFNCINYLNQYYSGNKERIQTLSGSLSGTRFLGNIQSRLKNIIYVVTLQGSNKTRMEEAFYFAVWSSCAPNRDIRFLAQKLLYEVVSADDKFIDILMEQYDIFVDPYIQETIIYVLSVLKKDNPKIKVFFICLINEHVLSAKSIRRISKYLKDDYGYIHWSRENLYYYSEKKEVSEEFERMLSIMDIMNRNFLPFRYWNKDHIDMYTKFLVNDKEYISAINKKLEEKFQCVKTGKCSGSPCFEKSVLEYLEITFDEELLDMNSFFVSFETIMTKVFNEFHLSWDDYKHLDERGFANSIFMKCVDIATGIFYGSLMCNYYVNHFASYNNSQVSIGYELYDPIEYGEEIRITTPVPIFNDTIERLGDLVIDRMDFSGEKGIDWYDDVRLTRKNLLSMIQPVSYKNTDWVLLAGRVSFYEYEGHDLQWKETYNIWCCTRKSVTITADGSARYVTIELDDYEQSLEDYREIDNCPWLCKNVKGISDSNDLFDETNLVLPPADIIRAFNLTLDKNTMAWINASGEKVVICNNTKNSYYRDPIGGSVFIRSDYYQRYIKENYLKFFAFSERILPDAGYISKAELHFEIENGVILKEIPNDGRAISWTSGENPLCKNCPYGFGILNGC